MKKKGFTLIELLVVLSIVSLLSTIIFASLNKTRSKSRDTQRIAQLRSLQNALELYRSDKGFYPISATANTTWTSASTWSSGIRSSLVTPGYIKDVPLDPRNIANCSGALDCVYKYYRYRTTTTTVTCDGLTLDKYAYVIVFSLENPNSSIPSTAGDGNINKCLHGSIK